METSEVTKRSPKLMPLYQKGMPKQTKNIQDCTGNVNTLCTYKIYEKTHKLVFLDK